MSETKSQRADNPVEFDAIVSYVRQSWVNSGPSQARIVAASFGADYGWNANDLVAAAERPVHCAGSLLGGTIAGNGT